MTTKIIKNQLKIQDIVDLRIMEIQEEDTKEKEVDEEVVITVMTMVIDVVVITTSEEKEEILMISEETGDTIREMEINIGIKKIL